MPNQYTDNRPIEERLLSRRVVDYNGCWLWEGVTNPKGYGMVSIHSRMYSVHRLIAKLFLGVDITDESIHVRHVCDVPLCFNPDHLLIGTNNDNVQDRFDRDKWGKIAKLSREDIDAIKIAASSGQSQHSIAREFGIAQSTVSRIVNNKRWSRLNRKDVV